MPINALAENPLLANPAATSPGATAGGTPYVNSLLPGGANLTSSASSMVGNLLNGLPSTSAARKGNAVFGAGSGLAPGSDFLKTRLFDTYGTQVDQRNQQGLQDFLALISGLSGPELAHSGQQNQASQFGQSLAQQKQQFADSLKQRQDEFNAQNDLALQQFGFNKSRYYSGQYQNGVPMAKPSKPGAQLGSIPGDVLGAGQANLSLDQNNAANPQWWY